ncbi:unnamed protein product [Prorocentrum cordatum]|uniref:tRNA synthetases class I catalytic domain-containing protein n=1 Tax=Prorocentrum cordatum TaxID=2364126 RepID=A0ABN9PJ72_9DINO|nr:unnamed protein product [Polarella glacialis]
MARWSPRLRRDTHICFDGWLDAPKTTENTSLHWGLPVGVYHSEHHHHCCHHRILSRSVYFSIDDFGKKGFDYRKLVPAANTSAAEMEEGEGALAAESSEKRNPNDFALWKASKPGEPAWESRWGGGRPGWHIECSVMATDIQGEFLDIHAGGEDLKFPHHDNEMAQSEAYLDRAQWVNYFWHAGHLHIEGLKMSKSLKNFITIRQAMEMHSARQLRMMFLMQPWDKGMNYSDQAIDMAREVERKVKHFMGRLRFHQRRGHGKVAEGGAPSSLDASTKAAKETIDSALADNFNTGKVVDTLSRLVSECYTALDALPEASLEPVARAGPLLGAGAWERWQRGGQLLPAMWQGWRALLACACACASAAGLPGVAPAPRCSAATDGSLTVSWADSAEFGLYYVQLGRGGGRGADKPFALETARTSPVVFSGLAPATSYQVALRALPVRAPSGSWGPAWLRSAAAVQCNTTARSAARPRAPEGAGGVAGTRFMRVYRLSEYSFDVDFLENHNGASADAMPLYLMTCDPTGDCNPWDAREQSPRWDACHSAIQALCPASRGAAFNCMMCAEGHRDELTAACGNWTSADSMEGAGSFAIHWWCGVGWPETATKQGPVTEYCVEYQPLEGPTRMGDGFSDYLSCNSDEVDGTLGNDPRDPSCICIVWDDRLLAHQTNASWLGQDCGVGTWAGSARRCATAPARCRGPRCPRAAARPGATWGAPPCGCPTSGWRWRPGSPGQCSSPLATTTTSRGRAHAERARASGPTGARGGACRGRAWSTGTT